MAEEAEVNDVATDAPVETPAPEPQADPAPVEEPSEAPTESPKAWGDDWRDQMSGGNEKITKILSRFRSPENVAHALVNAQDKIRSADGQKIPELGDDPTEEDIAKYREAFGIPDTVEGFQELVELPKAFPEADAELAQGFMEYMHESNMTPQAAQRALDWYQGFQETLQQDRNETMETQRQEAESQLRAEWGGEADGNFTAIKTYLDSTLGQETADQLRSLRAEDGSLLMNNPAILRLLAMPAVDYMGPNAIYAGDTATTAKTLKEKQQDLLSLRLSDPVKFKTDDVQQELASIYDKLGRLNK